MILIVYTNLRCHLDIRYVTGSACDIDQQPHKCLYSCFNLHIAVDFVWFNTTRAFLFTLPGSPQKLLFHVHQHESVFFCAVCCWLFPLNNGGMHYKNSLDKTREWHAVSKVRECGPYRSNLPLLLQLDPLLVSCRQPDHWDCCPQLQGTYDLDSHTHSGFHRGSYGTVSSHFGVWESPVFCLLLCQAQST